MDEQLTPLPDPIVSPPPIDTPVQQVTPSLTQVKRRWWRLIPVACILVVLLIAMRGNTPASPPAPADAAEAFFREAGNGNTIAAYDSAADAFRRVGSREKFDALVKGQPQLFQGTHTFASWNINGDRAVGQGTILLTDGTTVPLQVTVVREQDTWKISGFATGTEVK